MCSLNTFNQSRSFFFKILDLGIQAKSWALAGCAISKIECVKSEIPRNECGEQVSWRLWSSRAWCRASPDIRLPELSYSVVHVCLQSAFISTSSMRLYEQILKSSDCHELGRFAKGRAYAIFFYFRTWKILMSFYPEHNTIRREHEYAKAFLCPRMDLQF